jgi:hypothetical protein
MPTRLAISSTGNLQHRQALGGQQDDLRPLNVLHWTPLYV